MRKQVEDLETSLRDRSLYPIVSEHALTLYTVGIEEREKGDIGATEKREMVGCLLGCVG